MRTIPARSIAPCRPCRPGVIPFYHVSPKRVLIPGQATTIAALDKTFRGFGEPCLTRIQTIDTSQTKKNRQLVKTAPQPPASIRASGVIPMAMTPIVNNQEAKSDRSVSSALTACWFEMRDPLRTSKSQKDRSRCLHPAPRPLRDTNVRSFVAGRRAHDRAGSNAAQASIWRGRDGNQLQHVLAVEEIRNQITR
jgi:hypothetical protein